MKARTTFIILIISISTLVAGCSHGPSRWVNPFVGTDLHGHTTPAAILPFGQIQAGPDTRLEGWDGCSGYHYSDDTLYGFSHTHLSGTGCEDLGDILLMPIGQKPEEGIEGKWYRSHFSHDNEKARPGYYRVMLDSDKTITEITLNQRCAYHRYFFSDGIENGLVIDLDHRDKLRNYQISYDGTRVSGFRVSDAWNPDQKCFFALRPTIPFESVAYNIDSTKLVCLWPEGTRKAEVRVAISGVDIQAALSNLENYGQSTFDKVESQALAAWNTELGKIEVRGLSKAEKTKFYTALYHCMTAPYLWSEPDGRYRGQDDSIHTAENGHEVYTVFSLWDTYRALHPLMTLIEPQKTEDWIYTMQQHYDQGGELTMWELCGHETHCMIGYHAAPVILEALTHGILDRWTPAQKSRLLEAMTATANLPMLGRTEYARDGYISSEFDNESVSKTLEYAYDDWCIAEFARQTGNDSIYAQYLRRSESWRNMMDDHGFMHARRNGGWLTPFDPAEVNNHYTEANCWQYSTYVPHNVYGWIEALGGNEQAEALLDSLFYTTAKTSGRDQADITGLIGMYAHGNEPSHHAAFLYTYLGRPEKTQQLVDRICSELYGTGPDGLCGNEDCGQMSAWYVMAAMGFYPVCPGLGEYVTVQPRFNKVVIHGSQCDWVIKKSTWKAGCFMTLDNNGGFQFYDRSRSDCPHSSITTVPTFSTWNADCDSLKITSSYEIRYTLDGTEPDSTSPRYNGAIPTPCDMIVKAKAFGKSGASHTVTHQVRKFIQDRTLKYITYPAQQYSEGGENLLIDRQDGTANYKLGGWQGWQGDMEAEITLQEPRYVRQVSVGCLSDNRAWIFFPKAIVVDGTAHTITPGEDKTRTTFSVPVGKTCQTLRVKVINYGALPSWHISAGEQAWLFIDEISVE